MRLLGDLLLLLGAFGLVLGGVLYLTDSSTQGTALPRPVALAGVSEEATAAVLSAEAATPETPPGSPTAATDTPVVQPVTATDTPVVEPTAATIPAATPVLTPTPAPVRSGIPVRMVIPSIQVDSRVQEIGTYMIDGQAYWETVPFVVGHYRTTAKTGEKGNAVFSGHVTSRNAGNVFQDLYKVKLGDEIRIYTEESEFIYQVSRVRLVLPTEISVMDPTPDATATLITCAGEWIPDKREFSQRLIVVAKLKQAKTATD